MSIPKIIHYCWFGGGPISAESRRCMESWKKYCPDYKLEEILPGLQDHGVERAEL